eukprot:TRINITY_DN3714_c0_g1_i2.p1 TRINITY_DN3714_c0_g1~~TRINITY_DN3714_c0_g1_i2.p1  ORF type:complete len:174 (+),score=7.37 TRINITY_DN3714_c0_g1_i2:181-702(+)
MFLTWPFGIVIVCAVCHVGLGIAQLFTTLWLLGIFMVVTGVIASFFPCFTCWTRNYVLSIVHIIFEVLYLGLSIISMYFGFTMEHQFLLSQSSPSVNDHIRCDPLAEAPLWGCEALARSAKVYGLLSLAQVVLCCIIIGFEIYICRKLKMRKDYLLCQLDETGELLGSQYVRI